MPETADNGKVPESTTVIFSKAWPCPGGCVAGAGTMQSIKKSQAAVNKYAAQAKHKISSQTEYVKELDKLVD